MEGGGMRSQVEASSPYLLMTLSKLCLAGLLTILQSALAASSALSAIVIIVYQQILSVLLLSSLALLFERGERPKLTFEILRWAFLVGLLQISIGEMMLTASLRYITATYQSVAINTTPVWVFVLAVLCRQEPFHFWVLNGQAKLWGILASAAGAAVMVILSASGPAGVAATGREQLFGSVMVWLAVLAEAAGNVLVERVALKYPANITLSALISVFGTIQAAVVALFVERNRSAWMIRWTSLQLLAILYGGILVNGMMYLVRIWCIHKKGPVFVSAFSPLLVVFSFLLQKLILRVPAQFVSLLGAVPVIGGLYLLLWAKSTDNKMERVEGSNKEPLMPEKA